MPLIQLRSKMTKHFEKFEDGGCIYGLSMDEVHQIRCLVHNGFANQIRFDVSHNAMLAVLKNLEYVIVRTSITNNFHDNTITWFMKKQSEIVEEERLRQLAEDAANAANGSSAKQARCVSSDG